MVEQKIVLPTPNKTLKIARHSVLILSGPSECGKSHFSQHVKSELIKQGLICSVISSDDCRRELLQRDEHKHHESMMPISTPAFQLAYDKLRAYTTYPVNHDVIIFDSTALSRWSRKQIRNIAKENYYTSLNVAFDYDDEKEYYKYTDADWLVDIHLKKFKKEKPRTGYKITHRILPQLEYFDSARNCKVDGDMIVIGDVHGCYDQLIELLTKLDAICIDSDGKERIDPFKNVVFVGDLVDKGPESDKVVAFLLPNVIAGNCKVIVGNHENYLIKRWAGEINNDTGLEHFDSHILGPQFRAMLQEIHLRSYSYVRGDSCIVTHSPTDIRNLGKSSRAKEMRNLRHSQLSRDELMSKFGDIAKTRSPYFPLHIFGHIEFPKVYENKGMIGIDTGCVSGGRLTAIKVSGKEFKTVSVEGYNAPNPS
jgi:predicted kinase